MSSLIGFIGQLVYLLLTIYILLIVVSWVIDWAASSYTTPLIDLIKKLTNPFLHEIRRYVPVIGGIDFSPLVAIIVLFIVRALVKLLFNSLATFMAL